MVKPIRRFPMAIAVAASMMTQASIASGKDPLAAFVVLGQTGTGEQVALARVVIDKANAHCPSLEPAGGGDDKPKDQDDCRKDKDWPFGQMADAAAGADPSPDLVLHMGDYDYRGTPGNVKIKQDEGNDIKVRVYDGGGDRATNSRTAHRKSTIYGFLITLNAQLLQQVTWIANRLISNKTAESTESTEKTKNH